MLCWHDVCKRPGLLDRQPLEVPEAGCAILMRLELLGRPGEGPLLPAAGGGSLWVLLPPPLQPPELLIRVRYSYNQYVAIACIAMLVCMLCLYSFTAVLGTPSLVGLRQLYAAKLPVLVLADLSGYLAYRTTLTATCEKLAGL